MQKPDELSNGGRQGRLLSKLKLMKKCHRISPFLSELYMPDLNPPGGICSSIRKPLTDKSENLDEGAYAF